MLSYRRQGGRCSTLQSIVSPVNRCCYGCRPTLGPAPPASRAERRRGGDMFNVCLRGVCLFKLRIISDLIRARNQGCNLAEGIRCLGGCLG